MNGQAAQDWIGGPSLIALDWRGWSLSGSDLPNAAVFRIAAPRHVGPHVRLASQKLQDEVCGSHGTLSVPPNLPFPRRRKQIAGLPAPSF
jgi:hypothetical protein